MGVYHHKITLDLTFYKSILKNYLYIKPFLSKVILIKVNMDHLNPKFIEGINSKAPTDHLIHQQNATLGDEKVDSIAREKIHPKEEKASEVDPSSLKGRVSKGNIDEFVAPVPIEKKALREEESMLIGGTSAISNAAQGLGYLGKEDKNNISFPLYNRFESVFLEFKPPNLSDEVIVSIGDKTFNYILLPNDCVIIKDKSPMLSTEGYQVFKNKKDAALFLSIQKKPNPEYKDAKILWTYVSPSTYAFSKFYLSKDLDNIKNMNIEEDDFFDDLPDILERIFEPKGYCPEHKDQLIRSLQSKIKEIFESEDLEMQCNLFAQEEGPIEAIQRLQLLKEIPYNYYLFSNDVLRLINIKSEQLQLMCSEKLFEEHTVTSDGVNQKNFEDESLKIKKGEANYCCGSMAVQMLIDRIHKTGMTLNEILRQGVIRHQKLPALQMKNLTNISMILEYNAKEIALAGPTYKEKIIKPHITQVERFTDFFSGISNGTSGILHVGSVFLMCSIHDDGKIELFDSHGSSSPLISGKMDPAYRALFNTKEELSAYLSVHCRARIKDKISLYPIKVLPIRP